MKKLDRLDWIVAAAGFLAGAAITLAVLAWN